MNKRSLVEMRALFWANIRVAESGCWEWTGTRIKSGYGQVAWEHPSGKNRQQYAHRISWALFNGDLPAQLHVCHRCDNPPCVNPAHLFLGTDLDNARDRDAKGRRCPGRVFDLGSRHLRSKLTEDQVRYIRSSSHVRGVDLALELGVSPSTVSLVRKGRIWPHVVVEVVAT